MAWQGHCKGITAGLEVAQEQADVLKEASSENVGWVVTDDGRQSIDTFAVVQPRDAVVDINIGTLSSIQVHREILFGFEGPDILNRRDI